MLFSNFFSLDVWTTNFLFIFTHSWAPSIIRIRTKMEILASSGLATKPATKPTELSQKNQQLNFRERAEQQLASMRALIDATRGFGRLHFVELRLSFKSRF